MQVQDALDILKPDQVLKVGGAGHKVLLLMEGQAGGEAGYAHMGMYELMEGKLVNDRAVWKRVGKEAYVFHGANGKWFVCTGKATMEAGKAAGFVMSAVAADALVPTEAAAGK